MAKIIIIDLPKEETIRISASIRKAEIRKKTLQLKELLFLRLISNMSR